MKKIGFILFALTVFLISCDDPDCIKQGGTNMRIGFYSIQDGKAEPLRINQLEIEGINGILIEDSTDIPNIVFPINPADSELTIYFDTEFGTDTLTVGYSKTARLVSEDCGTEVIYRGINIIRSDFDSIRVTNSSMEINFLQPDIINENIRVYN